MCSLHMKSVVSTQLEVSHDTCMVLVLVLSLQTKEKKRKSHFSAAAVGALTHTAHLPHHEFLRHPYHLHIMAF